MQFRLHVFSMGAKVLENVQLRFSRSKNLSFILTNYILFSLCI